MKAFHEQKAMQVMWITDASEAELGINTASLSWELDRHLVQTALLL